MLLTLLNPKPVGPVYTQRSASWDIAVRTVRTRSASWPVEGRVIRTRSATWTVEVDPNIKFPVRAEQRATWNVNRLPAIPDLPPLPPGPPRGFLVVVRDQNLRKVGAVQVKALTYTSRFCDVGDWSLTLDAGAAGADALRSPGAGVVIYRGSEMSVPLISGPVRSRTVQLADGGLDLVVSGPDDMVWLADKIAYQMPARSPEGQDDTPSPAHSDRRSGAAEDVIKGYVEANTGQGAQVGRRRVTVAPTPSVSRGKAVRGTARMKPLLDLIRPLAETGGVGFRVTAANGALVFDVYEPTDRTKTAKFSRELRNLQEFSYTETAPTASYVIAGGSGEGVTRQFTGTLDADALAAWPDTRVERYIDVDSAESADDLTQAVAEQFTQNGPGRSLSVSVRDTPLLQFGRDYYVGDKVTIETPLNVPVKDVLREVTSTWSAAEGERITSNVGSSEATGTPKWVRKLRQLTARTNPTSSTVK